jgi:hypothetical protein
MRMAEMTDKEWEDLEVAEAQGVWEELNEADIEQLARPDYGRYDEWIRDPLWSEVLDGLWQGGTHDDDTHVMMHKPMITNKNFDTVITMYAYANPVDWFVKEFRYGVWDSDTKHFDVKELFDIVKLTHKEWKTGKRVLVRCQAGWNRSGLITALVLMRDGMPAQEAIELIREKRSKNALCNKNFVNWLLSENPTHWQGDEHGDTPKN